MADTEQPSDSATPGAAPAKNRRGVTIIVVVILAFAASMATYLVTRGDDTNPVDDVASALAASAPSLHGNIPVGDLQHTRCVATDVKTDFRCTPVAGTAGVRAVTVRWQNKRLTKVAAGVALKEAPRSGDAVGQLLALDDAKTLGLKVSYGCATTAHRTPAGASNTVGNNGMICVTKSTPAGRKEPLIRYVEFATDGTLLQDFPTSF